MVNITNEDNMELMARYEDNHFDLAIVDPPYRDSNQPTKDMRANGSMASLEGRPTKEYWDELLRVSKEQIIWGANNFQLSQWKGFVAWKKKTLGINFTMSMVEIASLSIFLYVSFWVVFKRLCFFSRQFYLYFFSSFSRQFYFFFNLNFSSF